MDLLRVPLKLDFKKKKGGGVLIESLHVSKLILF